ncbi:putative WD repeat-containing protein [Podosphaera aphanis]|nr:putative WD repeat-containing protein [Podosphaera aphanis]
MVKSYLKYEHSTTFGIVSSGTSNVLWCPDEGGASRSTGAGRAITAANEEVFCWDVKKGELLSRWRDCDCKSQVTTISQCKSNPDLFAVGYEDGSIRLWDSKIATIIVKFNGHRSAITTLEFDRPGFRLASGSRDTDVIVWDVIAEVGLFKLRGHKDQITGIHFTQTNVDPIPDEDEERLADTAMDASERFLLTTGKDALIKLWDLESRHCIETHITQTNGECWALGVSPDGLGCVTAGNDGELNIWSIDYPGLFQYSQKIDGTSDRKFLRSKGVLHSQGKKRVHGVNFHPSLNYFAIHGSEKAIELWRMRSEEEVKKSLARKRKRRREKQSTDSKEVEENIPNDENESILNADVSEFFVQHVILRTTGKARSVDWVKSRNSKSMNLLVATTNNQLEVYNVATKEKNQKTKADESADYTRTFSIELPGHRADIRTISLSSDDKMLASASNGGLKVWNVRTGSCIRTFECGYALSCAFLPGDKIVVVGTKTGDLELFDVVSATLLDSIKAHEGSIWTLQVHPDGKSLVTGSADKTAKFWSFNVTQEEIPGTKRTTARLGLSHIRTLKVSEDILSLRFSPDARLLAVALLDSTVKVFFVDSLKLFLNLYGHKLPVLGMDISYDSKLIVTCSADKNVRLWGLDFGDCHKAFFAHHDSVLQVVFVPHNGDGNGHHFFSSSKDKVIKYWDGDKFEQIQRLENHHGEIWALAASRDGEFVVSASHDKSIQVWKQTDEQIFLEEEKEKELEELYESTLGASLEKDGDEEDAEAGAVTKQTIGTLTAGEKIAEALEIGMADLELLKEWEAAKDARSNIAPPSRNILFMALGGINAEEYVLSVLQKTQVAELDDALLTLPFAAVTSLFTFIEIFAARSMNIPLTCRILFFMLKIHHRQIVASKTLKPLLDRIRGNLRHVLNRQKSEIGFNIAALKVISAKVKDLEVRDYVDEKLIGEENGGQRKRGFVSVS